MGVDAIHDIYNEESIKEAIKEFGDEKSYSKISIQEFINLEGE